MAANRAANQVQTRSTTTPAGPDAAAFDHAVRIIHQVCCFAGSFDLVEDFRDQALCAAVERHDSAALFDRLMHDFSFQGISDQIAINYMQRHGQATWRSVRRNLAKRPTCPKLKTYWAFHACGYEKTSRTCAEPYQRPRPMVGSSPNLSLARPDNFMKTIRRAAGFVLYASVCASSLGY
jgi:hypothetical protein